MSQTMDTTTEESSCQCSAENFAENYRAAKVARLRSGRRSGPVFRDPESAPLVWFDQVFGREITPSGTVDCPEALAVGATQNGLDVILVASHQNAGALNVAAAATITVTLLQADHRHGDFEEVGPTICVKAPASGITADPDMLVARFALGNFHKPWLKVRLTFAGAIAGGTVDCALGYEAR